jgi:hypothetical protein
MHERELDKELAAIAAQMASFQPHPGRLDRDRTMYLAGMAAASPTADRAALRRRSVWHWPAAFGAMTAVAACLLVALIETRQPGGERQSAAPAGTPRATAPQPPDNQGVHLATQPAGQSSRSAAEPFSPPYVSPAHWRQGSDASQPRGLCVRPLVDPYGAGGDLGTEPVETWPQRIRQTPPPLPYLEQRRALLEKAAPPADAQHRQGPLPSPIGA